MHLNQYVHRPTLGMRNIKTALTAALCAYALCASPLISDRSFTGVIVLAVAAVCVLLGDLDGQVRAWNGFKLPAAAMLVLVLAFGGYSAVSDVKAHSSAWDVQLARIEAARQAGEPAQIDSVLSHSPYTMDIRIESEMHAWPNSTLSRYFGVDVIGR